VPEVIHEVMEVFYNRDWKVVLENVQPDGSFSNSFEGRLLNPGHAIEAMWFIMDLGKTPWRFVNASRVHSQPSS
jgi:N-acylglucosamine 2-epimerase